MYDVIISRWQDNANLRILNIHIAKAQQLKSDNITALLLYCNCVDDAYFYCLLRLIILGKIILATE